MHWQRLSVLAAAFALGMAGCILKPIPQPEVPASSVPGNQPTAKESGLHEGAYPVYTFYDEDFQQGGFTYVYGGSTKISQQED